MSRTYKDRPLKLTGYSWTHDMAYLNGSLIDLPTTKPKRRKEVDTEDHWMTTPSWWTRITMNRPQRRAGRTWEKVVMHRDIEDVDPPGVSHKPYNYYW